MGPYWTNRFRKEARIWGDTPSNTAYQALELFQRLGFHDVLVPGSGYGRNTRLFSSAGFNVTGVEISDEAGSLADGYDPSTKVRCGSVLDVAFEDASFDAVYCFNVLHLFRESERTLLVDKCYRELRVNGICFFVVFSEQEESRGRGEEVEENTFESKPGRPVHYFSGGDLRHHFKRFEVLDDGLVDDPEDHGDSGPHIHRLRYIACRKAAVRTCADCADYSCSALDEILRVAPGAKANLDGLTSN
jgi:SAM-dependent methyltransferase